MKVFYDGETIINVEDGCPSIARLTEQGAEELPSSLFDGLEQFANSTNTTKANGDWEFDASEALGRLEETVRVERNCLLEASDKSQLPDLPMTDEKRGVRADPKTFDQCHLLGNLGTPKSIISVDHRCDPLKLIVLI